MDLLEYQGKQVFPRAEAILGIDIRHRGIQVSQSDTKVPWRPPPETRSG